MKLRNLLALGTFGLASLVGGCQEVDVESNKTSKDYRVEEVDVGINKTSEDYRIELKEIQSRNLIFKQDLKELNLKIERLHELEDQISKDKQEIQRLNKTLELTNKAVNKKIEEFYEAVNQEYGTDIGE
ncbi:MAG: hypothetical protein KJ939_06915 [Nanoarchaeota archaeon]|nr:hypothetical protein [Nanoarchaeota archaeon]